MVRMNPDKPTTIDGHVRRPRRPLLSHEYQNRVSTTAAGGQTVGKWNAEELASLMRRTPDVSSVTCQPEAFRWTDGLSGKSHVHVPSVLVVWDCCHRTYLDAMSASNLLADPTLAGIRARIEAECLARGAAYEIWTEDELHRDLGVVQALRPASSDERSAYAAALREQPSKTVLPPGLVRGLAGRLGLVDVRPVGLCWVGRGSMTGIPMALLCDLAVDPATRIFVWKPRMPGSPRMDLPSTSRLQDGAGGEFSDADPSAMDERAVTIASEIDES